MEVYTTEEQQVEAIKAWWKENGTQVLVGIGVGLALVFGWRQYDAHQIESAEAMSDDFAQVQQALVQGTEGFEQAKAFIQENSGSNYALMAAMTLAKSAVEQQQFDEASAQLEWVLSEVDSEHAFYPAALVRLARVQYQLANYDLALEQLAKPLPEAYKVQAEELKGDIYLVQQKSDLARQAYQAAADAGGLQGNPLLKQKLDDLAVAISAE